MRHIFAIILIAAFIMTPTFAEARIDMVPRIVVIENRERAGEAVILNLSNETREFDISLINYRQLEDGNYETLETPLDPNFNPDEIVRMSPRTFTLGPNGKQIVRMSLRKPADLPDGEYRYHFLALSKATDAEKEPSSENVQVVLTMNVGIAIPVVVRHGDLSVTSKLTDFELVAPSNTKSKQPELQFVATREGGASALGQITIDWSNNGGPYEEIGMITNFNLFTEINQREGAVPLKQLPTNGNLRIRYTDTETGRLYDEISIDL